MCARASLVLAALGLVSCNAVAPPATSGGPEAREADVADPLAAPAAADPAAERSTPTLASTYREPAQDVVDLVDARPTPHVWTAPSYDHILLADYDAHASIGVVAQPFERLAGLRIDARRRAARRTRLYEALTLVGTADASKKAIALPTDAQVSSIEFSPDGTQIALGLWADDGVQLWLAEVASAHATRLGTRMVNTVFGSGIQWMPHGQALLVQWAPAGHGAPPPRPVTPAGPTTLDTTAGQKATNRTYQDLLTNVVDEAVFEHLAQSELALVERTGASTALGAPAMITSAEPSPDGHYVLVERLNKPFSYSVPHWRFPRTIEVRDLKARVVRVVAEQPLADAVPIGGVRQGAREVHWQPTREASLAWTEALDGGDPDAKAEHRDRLMTHAAPFADTPEQRLMTKQRLARVEWTERAGEVLVTEYDRDRRWVTTHWFSPEDTGAAGEPTSGSRVLFDRSVRDAYSDPGHPVHRQLASGHWAVIVDDGAIYLQGRGATADGDRPFLARTELATGKTEDVMRSSGKEHVAFQSFASAAHDRYVVTRETAELPADYYAEGEGPVVRLTELPHPHPQLSGIQKRVLKYTRKDGVALSGTLYLPPDYDAEAQAAPRLPLLVWAYPIEYNDPDTAGQVRAAPNRFTRMQALSPLMLVTQGYAVLSGASMPVVGDPETMNDTFIEQIVWSAEAAIKACVAEGVADADRVAVGGHSYGAFMAANLLAHSDLFRAGVARSGAYNRSLTPFGFQSERRTLWEATDTYVDVSPLFAADKIDEPILLIHGEVDSNAGTYPLQSKRLFHALKGVGGTARLVLLPEESHGYAARESVLHVLAESFEWLDKYVKNAPAKGGTVAPARPG